MSKYVLCIHGGAGVIGRDTDPARIAAYRAGLADALNAGLALLRDGGLALDAVQAAVLALEENPLFNAGKGAVYDSEGRHELDASIMDGRDLSCGAAAGCTIVKHPILLARRVMEGSRHVLLSGAGADAFAQAEGLELVDNSYFDDPYRLEQWKKAKEADRVQLDHAPEAPGSRFGTVGAVALDSRGNLAAATSTGGMTNKRFGRVGDSPIIGAGTYADNRSCAVSCTGTGEEFIRHSVAYAISARMALAGESLEAAAGTLVFKTLKAGDGGLIAVDKDGNWALPYNSAGMFRGVADGEGLFKTAIWDE